ncbi:MAG TPA: sugar phosphate isomerase/epimerase family protein [Armatimonadota bacterium]|nr:sugar phosphate isomerase/epimerase family protein [Armatimonadota bacterium]
MSGTLLRDNLEARLDAVREYGFSCVQFSLSCAGLDPMPDEIDPVDCDRIRLRMTRRDITMSAVSGTFNMIHPDVAQCQQGLRRLQTLARAATRMGTSLITLCTGTRDPESMWRRHPDNDSPEAWYDLLGTMEQAIALTEGSGVSLLIEPEVSNVVDSARDARRLIDEIGSPRLKVCMDGANLFHAGELPRMPEILDEAFDLLGADIVLAHAKDLDRDGQAGHLAAGTGLLDYDRYLSHLQAAGFDGALILHSLSESQVPRSRAFISEKLQHLTGR